MKINYVTPSIEVIEIEIEDAILGASELKTDIFNNGLQDYNDYEMAW